MNPTVRLIYTNCRPNEIHVPAEMGEPRPDQLQGTPLDRLVELAGRVCYDSLGTGRNSVDYHRHIHEVGHGSVWEHANIVTEFDVSKHPTTELLLEILDLCSRPGVLVRYSGARPMSVDKIRITANLRAIIEWEIYSTLLPNHVGAQLYDVAKAVAPLAIPDDEPRERPVDAALLTNARLVSPSFNPETWLSFYIEGISRGLSHELVRHKYETGVSQRSTRFVDESESPWCLHPLIDQVLSNPVGDSDLELCDNISNFELSSRQLYRTIVEKLQRDLFDRGVDKLAARKQARGAARGILGNALETKMVFSCSLAELNHIIAMRASDFADAEIRLLADEMSRVVTHDERTMNLATKIPNRRASDGIGMVC